jgi:glyoxylase-like metal-dependent hydrolase (beta-lactamase superfamily II)
VVADPLGDRRRRVRSRSAVKNGGTVAVMAPVLPAFVEGLPDGVGCVGLPTPFRVGRVNCYVLFERPVTVVDPGTLQPGSLAELRVLLRSNRLDFDDVEQVVVTHHHADHCGAAAVLAARSGARIVCGVPEVAGLLEPADVQSRRGLLVGLGVPDALACSLIAASDAVVERVVRRPHPSMVTGVGDGDFLSAGGRQLRCVVTPGHAEGHLSLWDPAARVLFSGDHLLARIIPVPSLEGGDGCRRRRSLVEYLAGLSRFVALDPKVVLPGHGRAFTGVDVLAVRLRSHGRERANEVASILGAGPATPFEVARCLQWQPEGARLVLGLAHAQGHLDLLEDAGEVVAERDGAVVSYRLRG